MADLTAIILTKNEQKNLPDCLRSVAGFASRMVVVDSGSSDQTEAVAREFGAEFVFHPFESHARQFNWALDNVDIQTEWVLRIDADERMTDRVKTECAPILQLPRESSVHGISMEAVFYMLGRPLRFGGAKKRKLMIFRSGIGRIEDRPIDEHTVLSEGREVRIRAKFDHHDFKSVHFFAEKLNWYATREVIAVLGSQDSDSRLDGRIRRTRKLKSGLYYKFPKFFRALCVFLFRYVFQLGFLDGRPGLIYHFMYSFMYRFLVDAKLYEAERSESPAAKLSALDAGES